MAKQIKQQKIHRVALKSKQTRHVVSLYHISVNLESYFNFSPNDSAQ